MTETIPLERAIAEKRRHPRLPVDLTLDFYANGDAVEKCRGIIADLSRGGMSFKTNAQLEQGMCLHLSLDSSLQIRGEIRHITDVAEGGLYRYGVSFHKIGFGELDKRKDQENQQ